MVFIWESLWDTLMFLISQMYLRRPCKSLYGVISPEIPLNYNNLRFTEEKLRKILALVSSLTYLNAESLLPDINMQHKIKTPYLTILRCHATVTV